MPKEILSYPYCSLQDVQDETQNSDPDSVDKLIRSINKASRYIDEELKRDFLFHNYAGDSVATCVGTITLAGTAQVTVTAMGLGNPFPVTAIEAGVPTGVPLVLQVPVALNDLPAAWAAKVAAALAASIVIQEFFKVTTSGATITLSTIGDPDTTLNIAITNGSCTGITPAPTSVTTGMLSVPDSWIAGNTIYTPWPILSLTNATITDEYDMIYTFLPEEYSFVNPLPNEGYTGKIIKDGPWKRGNTFTRIGLLPRRLDLLPRTINLSGTFGSVWPDATVVGPGVPPIINQACTIMAAVRSGLSRKETVSFTGERQSFTQKTIPKEVEAMLSKYRIRLT